MNKKVRVKIELEFENESESIHFADILRYIIPDFNTLPIIHNGNVSSLCIIEQYQHVIDFLKASSLMSEGFEKMISAKKILDNVNAKSFMDEICRLSQINPDEYLNKTVIENVGGGHSIYNGELTEDDIRSKISNTKVKPQVFYITPDGDVNEICSSIKQLRY